MQALLRQLNAVPGVVGTMVCDQDGRVLAHAFPPMVELATISWIRWRFMDTPFLAAAFQIMVGGALVFLAGILIGNS